MLRLNPPIMQVLRVSGGVTRRRFLHDSTVLVAGASVLGLAACGGTTDPVGADDGDKDPVDDPHDNGDDDPGDGNGGDQPPDGIEVEMARALMAVGGTQLVEDRAILRKLGTNNNGFGDEPILLIRVDQDTVAANTVTCTHQQCQVLFNENAGRLDCPCHGSRYDLNGRVQMGPAPRPLKHFKATIHGDSVFLEDA